MSKNLMAQQVDLKRDVPRGLNECEQQVLRLFNQLSEPDRQHILRLLQALSETSH